MEIKKIIDKLSNKIKLIIILSIVLLILVLVYFFKSNKEQNIKVQENVIKTNTYSSVEKSDYEDFFKLPKHAKINILQEKMPKGVEKDELWAQLQELRAKNKLLFDDNLDLVNKNYEIALLLDEEKSKIKQIKQQILSKNLEAINESEKQHYQNINELTKRLHELQQENLNTTKDYEQKVVVLENKIEDLQAVLRQKDLQTNDEVAKATKNQRIQNSTLAEKNLYLLNEIEKLKQNSNIHTQKLLGEISSKKTENEKLKNMILEKENLINQILAKHTKELMDFDKEARLQVKKLKQEIEQLKLGEQNINEKAKKTYEQEINKLNGQIKSLLSKVDTQGAQSIALQKKDEQIAMLQTQLATQKSQISNSLSAKDEQNYKILNDKIILLQRQNKELLALKQSDNDTLTTIQNIQLKNEKLSEQNAILNQNLKEANEKIANFNSKNYEKIINEQAKELKDYKLDLESLKMSLSETENRLDSTQKQLELSLSSNQTQDYEYQSKLRNIQRKLDEKNTLVEKITQNNKELIKENASLKMKVSTLSDLEGLNTKLNKINAQNDKKSKELESEIAILQKLNDDYKKTIESKNNEINNKNSALNIALNDAKKEILNLSAIKEEHNELKNKYDLLSKENTSLSLQNNKKIQEMDNINKTLQNTIKSLNNEIDTLKQENKNILIQNQELDKKLTSITQSSVVANDENTKLLARSSNALKQMQEKIDELEKTIKDKDKVLKNLKLSQNVSLQNTPNASKNDYKLTNTIVCDDLKSGQKNLSDACKNKIKQAINGGKLFEIEPIVDDDGFSTLKNLRKNNIISEFEFNKLTNFANFGLGRDRGKKADEFIKSIKPEAKIYLSQNIKIEKNKRGFILKIYK